MPDGKHAAMSAEDMVALLSRSQIASLAVVLERLVPSGRWVALASFTVLLLARIPRLSWGKQLASRCLATSGGLVFVDLN